MIDGKRRPNCVKAKEELSEEEVEVAIDGRIRNFIQQFKKCFPCLLSVGQVFASQSVDDNQVD